MPGLIQSLPESSPGRLSSIYARSSPIRSDKGPCSDYVESSVSYEVSCLGIHGKYICQPKLSLQIRSSPYHGPLTPNSYENWYKAKYNRTLATFPPEVIVRTIVNRS